MHVPADKRDLSMVFQDYASWPHLAGLDPGSCHLLPADAPGRLLACRTVTASSGTPTTAMAFPMALIDSPVHSNRKFRCHSRPPSRCGAHLVLPGDLHVLQGAPPPRRRCRAQRSAKPGH